MKLKTLLATTAFSLLVANTTLAADLTGAFYLPGENQFTSDTKLDIQRTKYKQGSGIEDEVELNQEIFYGLTDNLSVFGEIGNDFDTEGEYNNDHNFDYEIGVAYNMRQGNLLAQVRGSYYTYNPKDRYGKDTDARWQKYIDTELRLGYDMGNDWTPYAAYSFSGQIDSADRGVKQSVFAGVHKYAGSWAADAGLLYSFDNDGENDNELYAQAELDYYLTENVAFGIYGDYYLGGQDKEIDKDYTTGFRVKVEF